MKKAVNLFALAIISVPFFASAMTTVDVEQQLNIYKGQAPAVLGASTDGGTQTPPIIGTKPMGTSVDTDAKLELTPAQVGTLMQGLKYTDKEGSSTIIKTTLKPGATDAKGGSEEVKKLQLFLNAEGSNIPATGKFGAMTKKAVMAYQKKKGLKADGVVGAKVRAAIAADVDAAIAAKGQAN